MEVVTNSRLFVDRHGDWGEHYHGAALASVAHFLAPRYHKVLIPGTRPGLDQVPWGSHPALDPLWSTESTEIFHDAWDVIRWEKVVRIVEHEIALRTLRVCWENRDGAYNCGRCEKCLRTMASLRLLGVLERCQTFTVPLDLEKVAQVKINFLGNWVPTLEVAEKEGKDPALARAVRTALAHANRMKVGGPFMYRGVGHIRASGRIRQQSAESRIDFAAHGPVARGGDFFLCASLIPAMRQGVDLDIKAPVSRRLLASTSVIQEMLHSWDTRFQKIKVVAPVRQQPLDQPKPEVGCFFTAGVDSFFTLFQHLDEIDRLIFVHGFDIQMTKGRLRRQAVANLRAIAAHLNKPLFEVVTNVRAFADPQLDWGKHYHGAALASVALFLSPRFRKVYLGSSQCPQEVDPWGSHPLLDPLWSTENTELVHDGAGKSRLEKIARIATHDIVLRTLRVCWRNPGGAYNCGQCDKCLRTMVSLRVAGFLDRCTTFPCPLDLEQVAQTKIKFDGRHYFFDNLQAARQAGSDPALTQALEHAWARSQWVEEFRHSGGPA